MSAPRLLACLALASTVLLCGGPEAFAANRSGYQAKSFRNSCRPPLKFAAGACVKSCPAGYRDTGRSCRFRSMSR